MTAVTVMVSGVGAVTGYGALWALRQYDADFRLVGSDIHEHAVGFAWADIGLVSPAVIETSFVEWLCTQVAKHRVELYLPTLEPELTLFADNPEVVARLASHGCTVALPGETSLVVSRDKWKLTELLTEHADPALIRSSLCADVTELQRTLGTPFLVKPRRGFGSRGVRVIRTVDDFTDLAAGFTDHLMAQELVGSDDAEFTVAVLGDGTGAVLARIVMRRWLAPQGMTMRAKSEPVPTLLDDTISRLTSVLKPRGAINLQLREHDGGYRLLEVNARLSSSTSIRTSFGYNEAGMLVDLLCRDRRPTQPPVLFGDAVRYLQDQVTLL